MIPQHPDVAQVVVFGVPDPKWKQGIKAVFWLRADPPADRQGVDQLSGPTHRPLQEAQYIEFVEDMPTTAADGIDCVTVKARHGG